MFFVSGAGAMLLIVGTGPWVLPLQRALEEKGCRVWSVPTLEEAKTLLLQYHPRVAIVSETVSGSDGVTALYVLRRLAPTLSCIFVAASEDPALERKVRQIGVILFVHGKSADQILARFPFSRIVHS